MKLAYADRDTYYGDPDFVNVPIKRLLSDEYTRLGYPHIDMKHASRFLTKHIQDSFNPSPDPNVRMGKTCAALDVVR